MYEAVEEYIQGENFEKLSYGNEGFKPIALTQLSKIISAYRQQALVRLMDESEGYKRETQRNLTFKQEAFEFLQ